VTLTAYEIFLARPAAQGVSTQFSVDYVDVRPDFSFPPFAGSARTCPAADPSALSQVELTLCIKEFDLISFNALPYAIFHECVSHVFQGPWNMKRTFPDPASLYAEGWMDYAALHLYDRLLEDGVLNVVLSEAAFPDLRRPSYAQAAALLHNARRAESSRDKAWSYRAMGAEAAEWLLSRLKRLPSCKGQASDIFLRLSFTINASELLSNDMREDFAHLMHHALQHAEPLARITPHLLALRDPTDISELLQAVWRLGAELWGHPTSSLTGPRVYRGFSGASFSYSI